MKEIPLSQNQTALVDDDQYDFLMRWKWHAHKKPGELTFYAVTNHKIGNGKRKGLKMHRIIMNVTDPKIKVDHIDHNGLNCLKSNMRLATDGQNSYNKSKFKKGTSKFHGVCWHGAGKAWTAHVSLGSKKKYLGLFPTQEDAAKARDEAAKKYYGEFANLNFKDE